MSSAIRLCSKCGWVYPSCYTQTKCKFCHTVFSTQVCLRCKELVPTEHFYVYKSGRNAGYLGRLCKPCSAETKKEWDALYPEQNLERVKKFIAQKQKVAGQRYQDWLDLTDLEFKPMNEKDWLTTCMYFDGCAICGDEHIEAREFFVPFKEGGRYTSWNMFPMCNKCVTLVRRTANPFIWLDNYLGQARKLHMTEARKQRLLEYFILQIERVRDNNDAGTS